MISRGTKPARKRICSNINFQLQIPRDLVYELKPGLRNEKTVNNSLIMTELRLPRPKYFPHESFVQNCNLRSLRVKKKLLNLTKQLVKLQYSRIALCTVSQVFCVQRLEI